MSEIETVNLKIGPYEIHPLPTGVFGLDGGAMFGTVPRVLWEKSNPPDAQNRIAMEARALLLKGTDRVIVVDSGNGGDFVAKYGEKLGQKFAEIYAVDEQGATLEKSLNKYGLHFEDVTDVILTHLHFDHAGGGTCARNGKIVPTFPKAKYYVQRQNLETARNPNIRERASYFAANFQPLLDANVLNLLDGNVENLLPHISVEVSNGHTLGQQIVKIFDEKIKLAYCADLIPTSSHIRLAWIMGYDLDPLKIIHEKTSLLRRAAAENWFLYFEHDPLVDAAQVITNKEDFAVRQKYRIS